MSAPLYLAAWLLALPFRIAGALGLRRTVVAVCVLVLAVTVYGVAEDLGLVEAPAQASPTRPKPTRQPAASSTAKANIPHGYLTLYRQAGARYQIPWAVLAAIGKVESDHGRAPPARNPLGLELRRRRRADAVRHRRGAGRQRLGHLRPRL